MIAAIVILFGKAASEVHLQLACTHRLQRTHIRILHCHIFTCTHTLTVSNSLTLPYAHVLVQNIKERHVNDDDFGIANPNNQVDAKYKDESDSANQVAAKRHQDVGESPHDDDREKANDVKWPQDAEVAFEDFKEEGVKQESYQNGANDGGVGK